MEISQRENNQDEFQKEKKQTKRPGFKDCVKLSRAYIVEMLNTFLSYSIKYTNIPFLWKSSFVLLISKWYACHTEGWFQEMWEILQEHCPGVFKSLAERRKASYNKI